MSDIIRRLEYTTRATSVERGLQARTADPLWMLCRQWQVGEFQGEDAASPIHMEASYHYTPVSQFQAEGQPARPLLDGPPLEAYAERETIVDGAAALRHAAEAGMYFLRLLDRHGARELRKAARTAFALQYDGPPDRVMALLARTAPDGRAVYAARDALPRTFGRLPVPEAYAEVLVTVAAEYAQWYESRFFEPPGQDKDGAWVPARMAYRFAVGATLSSATVNLKAEYTGGRLDWHAFDVSRVQRATSEVKPVAETITMLPARVRYAGMPAPRWWAFEDREVNFAGLEAAGGDIARLAIAEFTASYGDDWYILPVRVPAGSLVQLTSLTVYDTFGGRTQVDSAAYSDSQIDEDRPWRFFELAGDPFADQPRPNAGPLLFIPRVTANRLRGPVLEAVTFIRDETANMAWAVEAQRQGPHGRVIDRRSQWERPQPAAPPAEGTWRYRLATEMPPFFIPFVPERQSADGSMRLRRARMIEWDQLPRDLVGAQGRILVPECALRVFEETLPRGGAHVRRRVEMARGSDGLLYVWAGRQKRHGRGERSAGRRTDALEVPLESAAQHES